MSTTAGSDWAPKSSRMRPTYENFEAECPYCKRENVFNRASDLGTLEIIQGREIRCLYNDCRAVFWIGADLINSPWEMILMECHEHVDRKRYISCILHTAQSYEMFFGAFFRVRVVYKPAYEQATRTLADVNRLLGKLQKRIKSYSFVDLRDAFLTNVAANRVPSNLREAEDRLADMIPKKPSAPGDETIAAVNDKKLVEILIKLKSSEINKTRNKIIHKEAYRPKREEAEALLQEASDILYRLKHYLDIHNEGVWPRVIKGMPSTRR
jgi:hypothetical protein